MMRRHLMLLLSILPLMAHVPYTGSSNNLSEEQIKERDKINTETRQQRRQRERMEQKGRDA